MTIRFSIYFISVDRVPLMKTKTVIFCGIGGTSNGGTRPHRSAEDGDTSYLAQHPTCVFVSLVRLARPWQICSHIPPLFLSSFNIESGIMALLQKMKRE